MKKILILGLVFCVNCSNPVQFSFESLSEAELASLEENFDGGEGVNLNGVIYESFEITEVKTKIDILFVLDVSRSMRENLSKLGESMDSLLSRIRNFDWQMAFTTADHGDHMRVEGRVGEERWRDYKGSLPHFGRFMKLENHGNVLEQQILDKKTPSYNRIFRDTLTLNSTRNCNDGLPPYCQGGHEQPLRSLKAALERDENRGFFRKDADFIAIVITNEDERIEDPKRATTAQEVRDVFYSIHENRNKDFYGFGIIVESEDCYSRNNNGSTKGEYSKRVSELAEMTRGRNVSICQSDYGIALRGISSLIRERSFDRIQLREIPQEDSVQVLLSPQEEIDWVVRNRTIFFRKPLKPNTQVNVQYAPK